MRIIACFLDDGALINDLIKIIIGYIYDGPFIKGKLVNLIKEVNTSNKGDNTSNIFCPCAITTDGKYIYIGDTWSGTVCRFSKAKIMASCCVGLHGICYEPQIVVSGSKIYMIECYGFSIYVFNILSEGLVTRPSCYGPYKKIKINDPHIYISSYQKNIIFVFTENVDFINKITLDYPIEGTVQLKDFSVIDDEIYVITEDDDVIFCFSITGDLKFMIDGGISGIKFNGLESICATKEAIFIGDSEQIYQLEPSGYLINKWGKGLFGKITGITFLDGICYVADKDKKCVYMFQ